MNQKNIGYFMKELRNEKQLTQEQLSEILGVSSRTISRWETGNNMPDIVLLIEISDFYGIELKELLKGERENEKMDKNLQETVLKAAEYDNEEKLRMIKKINSFSIVGIIAMIVYLILLFLDANQTPLTDFISGAMLGLGLGSIIVSAIFTSRYGAKIKAIKYSIIKNNKQ